jgi:hypothetical protein
MTNLPTIEQLAADPRLVTPLPLDALAAILATIDERAAVLAFVKKAINASIADRMEPAIQAAYLAKGEDTGSVHVERDGMDVKVTRAKKVTWDQGKLAAAVAQIRDGGDDPAEYVDVAYSVPEAKYKAWPAMIRRVFEPARTVTPGNPSLAMAPANAEAA